MVRWQSAIPPVSREASPDREQLILDHMQQVELVARRIHRRVPETVSFDDLVSSGVVGLIAAVDHYDESLGVKLKTYAEYKIRGAILDALRGMDWATRQHRRRTRQIDQTITAFEREHGRPPEEAEVAQALGISLHGYQEWQASAGHFSMNSLDTAREDEEGCDLLRSLAGSAEEWPSQILERQELARLLAACVAKLPTVEQTVVRLHFFEERTIRDIARVIDLHESRASQLKTQAVARLRSLLRASWPAQGQCA